MDKQTQQKLIRIIARHSLFSKRVARMLAAHGRSEPLPADAEFHSQELQSLDSNSRDLCVEILGYTPVESDWVSPVQFAYKHGYATPDVMSWLKELQNGLRLSQRYFESFLVLAKTEVHVGDKVKVGSAHVVMTGRARARNIKTHGSSSNAVSNLPKTADELKTLRKALHDANPEEDLDKEADISVLTLAEKAARKDNHAGMLDHLKPVGKWVGETATKLGLEYALAALKSASGLDSK